jgi:hypothetical protein
LKQKQSQVSTAYPTLTQSRLLNSYHAAILFYVFKIGIRSERNEFHKTCEEMGMIVVDVLACEKEAMVWSCNGRTWILNAYSI